MPGSARKTPCMSVKGEGRRRSEATCRICFRQPGPGAIPGSRCSGMSCLLSHACTGNNGMLHAPLTATTTTTCVHTCHEALPCPLLLPSRGVRAHPSASQEGSGIAKLIPHVSSECVDLIIKLLAYNPDDRLRWVTEEAAPLAHLGLLLFRCGFHDCPPFESAPWHRWRLTPPPSALPHPSPLLAAARARPCATRTSGTCGRRRSGRRRS